MHVVREGTGAAADVLTGDSVQGIGLVHHRLFAERESWQRVFEYVITLRLEVQHQRNDDDQDGYARARHEAGVLRLESLAALSASFPLVCRASRDSGGTARQIRGV